MSVLDVLSTMMRGERPVAGLLHNCRLEALGAEAYGVEAVVERLGAAPFEITSAARVVQTAGHVAVFEGERAIFADLFDASIGRLWVLGPDRSGGGEPILAVPFDPDLDQGGGDLFLAASDHTGLAADAVFQVVALGRAVVADVGAPRTRAFAIRAFGTASTGAALFAVFRLRPAGRNVAGFSFIAGYWHDGGHRIIGDFGSEAALADSRWTPRIAV